MKQSRSISENKITISDSSGEILSIEEEIVNDLPDTVKMCLSGRFVSDAAHDFYDEMMALSSIGKNIILDLSKVSYIAASCLKSILSVQQFMDQKESGRLTLCNIPDSIYQELKSTGLTELLYIE